MHGWRRHLFLSWHNLLMRVLLDPAWGCEGAFWSWSVSVFRCAFTCSVATEEALRLHHRCPRGSTKNWLCRLGRDGGPADDGSTACAQTHTHADTHITHTHKACFLFYTTEHYCKVDLFTIITPVHSACLCHSLFMCVSLFVRRPFSLLVITLTYSHTHVLHVFPQYFFLFLWHTPPPRWFIDTYNGVMWLNVTAASSFDSINFTFFQSGRLYPVYFLARCVP